MTDQVEGARIEADPEADWYAVPDAVGRGWRSAPYLYRQLGSPESGPNGITGWPKATVHAAELREVVAALPLLLAVAGDHGDSAAVSALTRLRDALSAESKG